MKKLTWFITIGTIFLIMVVIGSCSKQLDTSSAEFNSDTNIEIPDQRESISLMSEDSNFVLLVTNMYNFCLELENLINANSLDIEQVRFKLEQLKDENLSNEEQFVELQKIFKDDVSSLINNHSAIFSTNWALVKNKFGEIDETTLSEACEEVLRENLDKKCGWRYSLCIGAATAGAILCHGTCEASAIATTAGAAIPVCIALCGTLQVWAGVQCYDKYCDKK